MGSAVALLPLLGAAAGKEVAGEAIGTGLGRLFGETVPAFQIPGAEMTSPTTTIPAESLLGINTGTLGNAFGAIGGLALGGGAAALLGDTTRRQQAGFQGPVAPLNPEQPRAFGPIPTPSFAFDTISPGDAGALAGGTADARLLRALRQRRGLV